MTLFQTTRPHYRTILTGTFYLAMLQSSTLMAASSESFPKSEDPIPAAVSTAVFGEVTLLTMGQGTTLPSAPLEEPAVRAGAGTGNAIPSDAAAVLSDHGSDDEELRGLIREARLKGYQGDGEVKEEISRIRDEKKQIKQAAAEASRREFVGVLRQWNPMKAEPDGAASSAAPGSTSSATASAAPAPAAAAIVPIPPAVPAIAVGHEALYQRFLEGRLEYRPDACTNAGLITLPFRDLLAPLAGTANPLSAAFDLSPCGDAGKYISINIGYKKAKIPANEHKVEVWICPKFLVERELSTTASYLAPIMDQWGAPVGYFWTWGGYDVKSDNYDYLLNGSAMDNDKNINAKWISGYRCPPHHPHTYAPPSTAYFLSHAGPHSYHPNFHVKL